MTTPAAPTENPKAASAEILAASPRLTSVDAYRGFVMFLMMAEVLHISQAAKVFPDSAVARPLRDLIRT